MSEYSEEVKQECIIAAIGGAPDMRGQLKTADAALRYILGGNATVTFRSKKTQTRFTYRITLADKNDNAKQPRGRYFVNLLSGPDNSKHYLYIGIVDNFNFPKCPDEFSGVFKTTPRSRLNANAPSVAAFRWVYMQLVRNKLPSEDLEIWHEGVCGRCRRKLTVPESIEAGFGPECIERISAWTPR